MTEPEWIEEKAVLALHHEQLVEFGGLAGVRDLGLLQSALGRAKNVWAYASPKPDAIRMAASYAYGLAKNHPFFDGNKRTALIACHLFLKRNGFILSAPQAAQVEIVLNLASGSIDELEFERWLRKFVRPAE